MATTGISSPQYPAAAFMIIILITLPFNADSSANTVRLHPQNTKTGGHSTLPPPSPTTPVKKATVDSENKLSSAQMMKQFLDCHNKARASVGHPPLHWNNTLANIAKQWALQRVVDCKMIHSKGYDYAENIFWGGRYHWTPEEVTKVWVDEKAHYKPNTNECAPNKICGHYTQIIWRDTTCVGCALTKCLSGRGVYVICTYYPPGNYQNEDPFGHWMKANATLNKIPEGLP